MNACSKHASKTLPSVPWKVDFSSELFNPDDPVFVLGLLKLTQPEPILI